MAGSNLDKLKKYIDSYIGLPYWSNKFENGPFGGKGTSAQIRKITQKTKSNKQIDLYRFQKKHHIGIDCSGLAYHLLNYWYKLHTGKSVKTKIIGTQGKFGPKRVNVHMLTDPRNSIKINNSSDIKTADLIVLDGQKHVLFIIEKTKDKIYYVHSSQKTQKTGVHYGTITIINPGKSLNHQQFSDLTKTNITYQNLFKSTQGDGIYRLISLQSIPHT